MARNPYVLDSLFLKNSEGELISPLEPIATQVCATII
jgi:hypothetical protein